MISILILPKDSDQSSAALRLERMNASEKPNKNELRTRQTRELLLRAAETIFVKDGYEGAELGEIARLAGRTKGAIYDHFKSKEDIFLALVEERTQRAKAEMEQTLGNSKSKQQNLVKLRELCLGWIEDREFGLLLLEFKLFAFRHPECKDRLQKYYDEVLSAEPEKKFVQLLGAAGRGRDALSRSVAVRALHPLICSLILEATLAPAVLDGRALKTVVDRIFDALFHV